MSKKINQLAKTKERRQRVVERLNFQLRKKVKPAKDRVKADSLFEDLTKEDVERINKELTILKGRV